MFLPIGTDRPLRKPTLVNHALIGANVAAFLTQMIVFSRGGEAAARFEQGLYLIPESPHWWAFLSYQFLHGGLLHLAGNMLFLWVFGPNVEDRLGRIWYLLFYLVGGVAAGGMHVLFEANPVIGASGSIAAVTGAYIVFFPRTRIKTLVLFFVIGMFEIPATWFIGFAIAKDLFLQTMGGGMVAHLAHLGGYAFGIAVPTVLLLTGVLPHERYDLFGLGRHAKRRRDLRSAASQGRSPWIHDGKPPPQIRSDPDSDRLAERRADVSRAMQARDRSTAIRRYIDLTRDHPSAVMNRDAQLEMASWLFEDRRFDAADDAYERFLSANTSDREADRVRVMSALIRSRYLEAPHKAAERLRRVNPLGLSARERELYDALCEEAGVERQAE